MLKNKIEFVVFFQFIKDDEYGSYESVIYLSLTTSYLIITSLFR